MDGVAEKAAYPWWLILNSHRFQQGKDAPMHDSTIPTLPLPTSAQPDDASSPSSSPRDALADVLREGARRMLPWDLMGASHPATSTTAAAQRPIDLSYSTRGETPRRSRQSPSADY